MQNEHVPPVEGTHPDIYAFECGERVLDRAKQVAKKIAEKVKYLSSEKTVTDISLGGIEETKVNAPLPPT